MKKQVSNCWPNVQLLEQFGCLVYLSDKHPGLTKARIYQQTAEDNFQQHCAQSKGRDSNDLIKPFEPECWSDFLISHRLGLLCCQTFLMSALSGKTVVMVSRGLKMEPHQSSLRSLQNLSMCPVRSE